MYLFQLLKKSKLSLFCTFCAALYLFSFTTHSAAQSIPKNDAGAFLKHFCTKVGYTPGSIGAIKDAYKNLKAAAKDVVSNYGEWTSTDVVPPRNCLEGMMPDYSYRPPGELDDLYACFNDMMPTYDWTPPNGENITNCMGELASGFKDFKEQINNLSGEEIGQCMSGLFDYDYNLRDFAAYVDMVEGELKRFLSSLENLDPMLSTMTGDGFETSMEWLGQWCNKNKKLFKSTSRRTAKRQAARAQKRKR